MDFYFCSTSGLIQTVGKTKAFSVLKGCQVHWMRSVLRVASRVCQTDNEQASVFSKSWAELFLWQKLKMMCLKCSTYYVEEPKCPRWICLDGIVEFEDVASNSILNTHWNKAESWCQWWTQERHLIETVM